MFFIGSDFFHQFVFYYETSPLLLNSKCIVIKANCRYIQYFKQQNILHFMSAVQAKTSLASCYFLKKKMARKRKNSTVETDSKLVL